MFKIKCAATGLYLHDVSPHWLSITTDPAQASAFDRIAVARAIRDMAKVHGGAFQFVVIEA